MRVLFGLLLVLFPPGYSLIAALFLRMDDPDARVDHVSVSGSSIAVVLLIGLGLNCTQHGIRLMPILVVLSEIL